MRMTLMRWPLRLAGAALLAASAAVHLDLYLTGYRTIPTIGPLFLLQVIVGFALALAIVAAPLAPVTRRPAVDAAVAAAGAGFAVATLGGYLLTLWVGLFGFREIRTTAGTVAGILEIAAFAALATLAVLSAGPALTDRAPASQPARDTVPAHPAPAADPLAPGTGSSAVDSGGPGHIAALRRWSLAAVAGAAVAAAVVFGASVATASGGQLVPSAGGSALLRTTTIGGVSVLTNASGRTLYWFAPDTPSRSACYGECAAYWPPVTGAPQAGPGVALSKLGTIRRTDGSLQVTYDGHPLYTYIGDTGPGQASGNDINLNGGLWHEVPAAS
jgi:predicted lipoprotein with Yx(FWY)xxD motif